MAVRRSEIRLPESGWIGLAGADSPSAHGMKGYGIRAGKLPSIPLDGDLAQQASSLQCVAACNRRCLGASYPQPRPGLQLL